MNKTPTMAQILALFSVIVIPVFAWGVSIETRFTKTIYRIEQNEKTNFKIEKKIDDINKNTLNILIELERLKK